jgi:PrtD family type I secretion system ABC transporter
MSKPVAEASSFDGALRACRAAFVAVGVTSAAVNILMLTSPIYMMQVFDRVMSSHSIDTLVYLTLITLAAMAVMSSLDVVRGRLITRIGAFLDHRLGPETFERVLHATVQGQGIGVQPLRDLGQLRALLGSTAIFPLFDAPWLPLYLGIVFLVHPVLGVIAVVGAVVLFGIALLNETRTRTALTNAAVQAQHAMNRAEAGVRNAEAIEAMGMLAGFGRLWRADIAAATAEHVAASDRGGIYQAIARTFRQVIQIVMYACGAWLVIRQDMTAGAMTAATIIMARGLSPVEQAIGGWRGLVAAQAAYRRLRQFFAEQGRAAAIALPEPTGRLVVDRLTYAPRGASRLLLKGISFQLAPGEVLAIAGPSGAGKSTLARALVGVITPVAGHVRLDDAELQAWNKVQLGRYVGYLPQDIELFGGTVRDNIARMGEAEDADVVAAARLADVHELILHLPHGYHTRIGDGGAQISAGQRQRVALARAAFGSPRLVVLDEPDSALDIDGEAALERAIRAFKQARATVVVVTHRPRLLGVVDKILVLRAGALEAFGPATEVAQRLLPQALHAVPKPAAEPKPPPAALARVRKETAS